MSHSSYQRMYITHETQSTTLAAGVVSSTACCERLPLLHVSKASPHAPCSTSRATEWLRIDTLIANILVDMTRSFISAIRWLFQPNHSVRHAAITNFRSVIISSASDESLSCPSYSCSVFSRQSEQMRNTVAAVHRLPTVTAARLPQLSLLPLVRCRTNGRAVADRPRVASWLHWQCSYVAGHRHDKSTTCSLY